jgi:integrase
MTSHARRQPLARIEEGRPQDLVLLSEDKGRITYLTIAQVKALSECAKRDENAQVYPFIVIGLSTSMRTMEILSIRREEVDLQRRVIYVPKAKAGAREQPITAELATFLDGYMAQLPERTPWLFPSAKAKSGHTMDIRKPYRRVVEAAGLDPTEVVRHTLRHTAITHLVQAGVDLPTIKRISGHKTLQMVERYAHANGEHIAAAMDKLEQRYKERAAPVARSRESTSDGAIITHSGTLCRAAWASALRARR